MTQVALIYTVCSDAAKMREICEILLSEKLVACANRLGPITSHYIWDGAMQSEEEHPLILKTDPAKLNDAIERLRILHPYDVPAITGWLADSAPDFAEWVARETGMAMELKKPRRPNFEN